MQFLISIYIFVNTIAHDKETIKALHNQPTFVRRLILPVFRYGSVSLL